MSVADLLKEWSERPNLAIDRVRDSYSIVIDYARQKATAVDYKLWDKAFKRHVPYKTPFKESRHWGRDRWIMFDGLPKEFRDMVNHDPKNPDDALDAAIELWRAVELDAMNAMDRIVQYENNSVAISKLPEWLRGESQRVCELVHALRYQRILLHEGQKREAQEREIEREKRLERERKRERRFFAGGYRSYYTLDDDTKLSDAEILDPRGIPPHEYRRLVAEARELRFKKHTYYVPPQWYTVDKKKAEEIDNKPPAKIHPVHVSRGRNF